MKGRELYDMILSGKQPVATFSAKAEDWETCIDANMKGRLVRVEPYRYQSNVFELFIDLNEFDEHNDQFAVANYYNTEGIPIGTAKEVGFYPKDGVQTICMGYDDEMDSFFTINTDEDTTMFPLHVHHITVICRVVSTDRVCIHTTLPSPFPPEVDDAPAVLTLEVQKGKGAQYVRDNFRIEPRVVGLD